MVRVPLLQDLPSLLLMAFFLKLQEGQADKVDFYRCANQAGSKMDSKSSFFLEVSHRAISRPLLTCFAFPLELEKSLLARTVKAEDLKKVLETKKEEAKTLEKACNNCQRVARQIPELVASGKGFSYCGAWLVLFTPFRGPRLKRMLTPQNRLQHEGREKGPILFSSMSSQGFPTSQEGLRQEIGRHSRPPNF